MFAYVLLGLLATVILVALFFGSRWVGERGWVYNKHNPRPPGSGIPSGAFGQILKPELEYMVEEMASEQVRAEQDESGDDLD